MTRGPRRAYNSARRVVTVPPARLVPVPSEGAILESSQSRALLSAARKVRANALAPYSKFPVGAAVMDERGRVHVGCNVENASFGLTVCAERNAVAAAIAAGARRIVAVAVVAQPIATPCGACRQVLAQVAGDETPVLLAPARGQAAAERCRLGDLLPRAFRL